MAVNMVKNYVLRYDLDNDRPWVIVHYQVGGAWKNVPSPFPSKTDSRSERLSAETKSMSPSPSRSPAVTL